MIYTVIRITSFYNKNMGLEVNINQIGITTVFCEISKSLKRETDEEQSLFTQH